ncbi:MAG: type II secretion system protein N [Ottowia sp.]|nr:type II secretion system protein N [Ottowia sp.]
MNAASRRYAATRTWRPWGWAILGAVTGALAVLLALAPARWLGATLARVSNGMVTLAETDGTLWSGTGVLAFSGGAGSRDRARLPGRVRWRIRPALAGARARIEADCCTLQQPLALALQPTWRGARVTVANSQTRWPATVLAGLGTPWNTIRPQGELALQTQDLALAVTPRGVRMAGRAELVAQRMSSNLATVRPLGSYQLVLTGGETLAFSLSTLEGSLLLSGSGSVVAGNLRFRGEAEAAAGMQAQLANLLNLLGRRQGDRAIISFG